MRIGMQQDRQRPREVRRRAAEESAGRSAMRIPRKAPKKSTSGLPKPGTTRRRDTGKSKQTKIRLLIADDHALILEGLAATIGRQEDMIVVAQANNGREAVEMWKAHRPDVALLDLRMPQLNGVAVIREIRDLDVAASLCRRPTTLMRRSIRRC